MMYLFCSGKTKDIKLAQTDSSKKHCEFH